MRRHSSVCLLSLFHHLFSARAFVQCLHKCILVSCDIFGAHLSHLAPGNVFVMCNRPPQNHVISVCGRSILSSASSLSLSLLAIVQLAFSTFVLLTQVWRIIWRCWNIDASCRAVVVKDYSTADSVGFCNKMAILWCPLPQIPGSWEARGFNTNSNSQSDLRIWYCLIKRTIHLSTNMFSELGWSCRAPVQNVWLKFKLFDEICAFLCASKEWAHSWR